MASHLDPLAASSRIEHDYRSYLETSFAPLDPELRAEFRRALSEPHRIRKGPYLQATPPYAPGASVGDLVRASLLHSDFLDLNAGLPPSRPLYVHQEAALRTCASDRNMIVATGTGSGKTECYLLPILDHLLRERAVGTIDQPGVRALLLYPMNALANDQMKRIRELFAPFPELTFGRYVGDTHKTEDKALVAYRRQHRVDPPAGEMIDRATMQIRPPHVLLTNFAMLEYLLLRPNDSAIFDGPTGRHWRFVVLDEVHVYDGAKGAEVAMLLRRVRDRVHASERGRLRCIGTSATLGGGVKDSAKVAEFATALFDEPFDADGVVHPVRLPLQQGDGTWTIDDAVLAALHDAWAAGGPAPQLAEIVGRPGGGTEESVAHCLWRALHDEQHVVALQARLEAGSSTIDSLVDVMAGASDPARSIVRLVDLCVAAREHPGAAALIPARYHLWLRASEGSFTCLHPNHPTDTPRVRLDRFASCPSCKLAGTDATMLELAVCRHCRRHVLVGRVVDDRFELASGFESDLVHLLPGVIKQVDADIDEDEEAIEGEAVGSPTERALCLGCGRFADRPGPCECSNPAWLSVTQLNRPDQKLGRCPVCERRSNSGVASRFLSGSEAPVSVIAASLYQSLPPTPGAPPTASADGRKLLMFSDSRQDAAFFAPYLGRTYSRALERRLVWDRLATVTEPAAFEELVQPIRKRAERLGVLDPDGGAQNSATVKAWLLAEVLATDRRQSLDGVGLAEVAAWIPSRAVAPALLTALGFGDVQALDIVRVLLESVRLGAAVTVPDEVNVREDQRFAPRNVTTWLRGTGSSPGVIAWMPSRGSNRRLDYLERLSARTGIDMDSRAVLQAIWDHLTEPDSPFGKTLVAHDVRVHGTVHALDHERFQFVSRAAGATAYRCSTCRQLAWRNVGDVCPTYRCTGTLEPETTPEPNHYLDRYEHLAPIALTVEEHTGQLRSERAANLQEKFTRGELNALSCSTTFELGVDVGEVQAVLMRNVPPSPANYVQRAGRSGRRLGSAALVVTFAQRRSHDRSFYDEPRSMIDGVVAAPFIATDNESIIRRHVHAVAFAQFERERVDGGGSPVRTMGELVANDDTGSIAAKFEAWLRSHPASLQSALTRILGSTQQTLGIDDWSWVDRLFTPDESGTGGWFTALIASLQKDLDDLAELEAAASGERKHNVAAMLHRAQRTISERRVLDRFAQGGVLPKYGFPVDVVELDLSRSQSGNDLDLNRDLRLGILEFAPGAKVVAANRLWKSVGLKLMPGRELPLMHWGICDGCECLRTAFAAGDGDDGLRGPCQFCQSETFKPGRRGKFIAPQFGFVGAVDDEKPGETRPPREGHLETYFADFDGPPPPHEVVELGGAPFNVRLSRRGWITVFNRGRSGRGFWYCSWCGHAQDTPPTRTKRQPDAAPHKRPNTEKDCAGRLWQVDLGHRFLTNVVELDLPLDGPWPRRVAASSAMHALLSAVPAIGITQNDLGGSLAVGSAGQLVEVLFDDVPGGAGHSRHLHANLGELVRAAVDRMAACSCGAETSCYGCLRSYRNQAHHDELIRQAALDVLKKVVA